MATYLPPTEDLPTFDTLVFSSLEDNITIANGDTRYLRFPVSQGSETISGDLTVTGTTTTANADVTGTLTAGTFAPVIINCATLNSAAGTNQTVGGNLTTNNLALGNAITTGQINIGNSLNGGTIDIGKGTGGTIAIADTNGLCGIAVQICSGASVFINSTCVIGQNSALSIDNETGNFNLSTTSTTTSGELTIANEGGSNRTIKIGRNNAITITNAATSTVAITGTTNINTGGTATTTIGNNGALTINNNTGNVNLSTTSTSAGTLSIANEAGSNRTINIGRNNALTITNAATSTVAITGTTNINTGGTATSQIGNNNASSNVNLLGTVNVNVSGTQSTSIGNATGTTTVTGTINMNDDVSLGSSSADTLTPNGTLSKPFIIGYGITSAFSLSSSTPVTTYLGGTLQSSTSSSNVATNTFQYPMSSVSPYTAGGGISLTAGTYMFWMGLNAEDTSAFDITDLRMGITTTSTLSNASNEAAYVGGLPNYTCYFHKTDAGDAASADSENRVLSGCFNISSTTTLYPFWFINTTVNIDTVHTDVIIVKIGN